MDLIFRLSIQSNTITNICFGLSINTMWIWIGLTIQKNGFNNTLTIGSLQHLMVRFLEGVPSSEVYRDAIEHEVGRELTSAARECSGQMRTLFSSFPLHRGNSLDSYSSSISMLSSAHHQCDVIKIR
jgi:hypothetical protein